MPQLEFKILKMPFDRQEFYSYTLRCFGWQVQSMQETTTSVVSRSFGTSHNSGMASTMGSAYFPRRTDSATFHSNTYNSGWGSQMNMGTTKINTVLTVTYARDLALPNRDRLAQLESQCMPHVEAHFARVDATKSGNTNWTQWQQFAWFTRCGENLMAAGTEDHEPATASFRSLRAIHNVVRDGAEGMEFHVVLDIDRRKGLNCLVVARLLSEQGLSLRDTNACYDDRSGNVAVASIIKPGHDGCRFDDLVLPFLPYSELHVSKRQNLQYYLAVLDMPKGSVIAQTDRRQFSFYRHAFGRIEAVELTTGPVQTIGNKPRPAITAPPPAPVAPGPATVPAPTPSAPPATATKPAAPAPTPKPAEPVPAVAAPPKPAAKPTAPRPARRAPSKAPKPRPAEVVTGPKGAFGEVFAFHNQSVNGRPGVELKLHFAATRKDGSSCRVCASVLDADGAPLGGVSPAFKTDAGMAGVSFAVTPRNDYPLYNQCSVHLPYGELDLPDGEHDLQLRVSLSDEAGGVLLAEAKPVGFHLTKKGDTVTGKPVKLRR